MNDDELRDQLERRTTSAPLAPAERMQIAEAVHSRSSKRASRLTTWSTRLAIPMAATGTIIVFVLAFGFPRPPAAASPTPGGSPFASSSPMESESTSPSSPSASPSLGLDVLSADQLAAVAADPSKVGAVVISNAVINFVPSPTQFDVPDASPQAMGTIDTSTGPMTVIGTSFPDTNYPDHAFQVLDGSRVLYLGAVNDNADHGTWGVAEAIAAAPPESSSILYAVDGWLLQTAAAPCVAPPDFNSPQDYWCGGSWLLPDKPAPPADGTIHLQYPGAIHVQWSAYSDYAENPQPNAGLGGDPRLGTYLVRPAGCPPNVMGNCPVWEMLARLNSSRTPTPETPTPADTPAATSTPASSGSPLALETDPPSIPGNGCMLAGLLPVRMAHAGDHVQFLWAAGGKSDGTEAHIVWPAGFSAWLVDDRAELRDPSGRVVAVDGDVLDNLGGGVMGDDRFHVCSIGNENF